MFVLPFATQIKHESGTPIPDGALKQEVTFCVQGVISPLLSNLYLNEVDKMLERAREVTRNGKYTNVEYARFADDLVVLIHAYKTSLPTDGSQSIGISTATFRRSGPRPRSERPPSYHCRMAA